MNPKLCAMIPLSLVILAPALVSPAAGQEADELQASLSLMLFLLEEIPEFEPGYALTSGFAWIGNLLKLVTYPTQPAEVNFDSNLYAAHILVKGIESGDVIGLGAGRDESARAKVQRICSHFLFTTARSDGGGWTDAIHGRSMNAEITSKVVMMMTGARALGILPTTGPEHSELSRAVSGLISTQNPDGGWGVAPESREASVKASSPYITSTVLMAILSAKASGFTSSSLDVAISGAIDYLEATAVDYGTQTYWRESKNPPFAGPIVTAYCMEALSEALTFGFEVDRSVLEGASRYGVNYLTTGVPLWQMAFHLLRALTCSSAVGIADSRQVEQEGLIFIYQALASQDENGLFALSPFLWESLWFSYDVMRLLVEWHWMTSLGLELSYTGLLTEYYPSPPRLVEGGNASMSLTIINEAPHPLSVEVETLKPPEISSSAEGATMDLSPGGTGVFTMEITARENLSELTSGKITFVVKDSSSGTPIRSLLFNMDLARNAKLELASKQTSSSSLRLGDEATITVRLRNSGDVAATGVTIYEEPGSGFNIVSEGSLNSSLAASFAATGSYPLGRIDAGGDVLYSYKIKALSSPAGSVLASLTRITYYCGLNRPHNLSKGSNLTVLRPELVVDVDLPVNLTELRMPWGREETIGISLRNAGNSVAKRASLRIQTGSELSPSLIAAPNGSNVYTEPTKILIELGDVASNETADFVVELATGRFYTSFSKQTYFSVSTDYEDEAGNRLEDYEYSVSVPVEVVISATMIILITVSTVAVVGFVAFRIRRAMAGRRRYKLKVGRRGKKRLG